MTRALLLLVLALAGGGALLSRLGDPHVEVTRITLAEELAAIRTDPLEVEPRGTALLLHGVTASAETLAYLSESLARAGYRCLALDQPGHGDSPGPLERSALEAAALGAAHALTGEAQVDLLVGHSMGAYVGARLVASGRLRCRLFVSIGARTDPSELADTPTFLVTGMLDPLVGPATIEALAARATPGQWARARAVPWCDHALEPFHPLVVRAILSAVAERLGAASNPTLQEGTYRLRVLGLGLCLLAGLLAQPLLAPRREERCGRLEAIRVGLAGGAVWLLAAGLGVHGVWFHATPGGKAWLGVPLLVAAAGLGSWGLTRAAGRLLRRPLEPQPVHALTVLLALVVSLALGGLGSRFAGLLLAMVAGGAALGGGLGAYLARRTRHPATMHAAFAVCVGYLPGLWTRVFL